MLGRTAVKLAEIRTTLTRQAQVLTEFGDREQELQEAVMRRDWPAVDELLSTLDQDSRRFATLDEERHALVSDAKTQVGLPSDAPFAELIEHVEEGDRRELVALFRSLQVSVRRVRSVTHGIDAYVQGVLRATHDVLGEVFPDQKGTIYSSRGRRSFADGRAMVVDRQF